jgi:hypothetical protein
MRSHAEETPQPARTRPAPKPQGPDGLLELQRQAGNAAVSSLIGRAAEVQRHRLDPEHADEE